MLIKVSSQILIDIPLIYFSEKLLQKKVSAGHEFLTQSS